ncbi:hypothetical protein BT67DRAFT_56432 [Trichocladium antarcticum]|uniref:Uncharacterized protein n=1 Tax=Trichocladium antarcticum TaxID=1450529 RepID=A0AAN6UHV4_9PEZI|nr:hypothetical protein BT67DRAFT_56432 [Trichocladium antarcticum]
MSPFLSSLPAEFRRRQAREAGQIPRWTTPQTGQVWHWSPSPASTPVTPLTSQPAAPPTSSRVAASHGS